MISPALKSFHFEGTGLVRLNGIWDIKGSSLEEVSLTGTYHIGWKACMNGLRVHCRKISKILLDCPVKDSGVSQLDHADLLVSYRNQLLKADISCMTPEKSARVDLDARMQDSI